jgi:uncharacterized protein HemY
VRVSDFLVGLPAVLVALVMAVGLGAAPAAEKLTKTYEAEGAERVKTNDWPGALLCYRRVSTLAPARVDVRFVMALVLERLGRAVEAESIARSIAPTDTTGYPAAHLWLARRICSDPNRVRYQGGHAEGHLLRFLQAFPNAPEANALLGGLYIQSGRFREAKSRLEKVAGGEPERLIDLAEACHRLGEEEDSLRHARAALQAANQALGLIDQALERSPGDPRLHATKGEVLIKLERWKEAVTELELGLTGGAASDTVHMSLATAYDKLGMSEIASQHRRAQKQ